MSNLDFGIHLSAQGADQAAAGVAKVTQAASAMERATVSNATAQANLASATLKAQAAAAAHAKTLADASASQDKIAQSSAALASAQARAAAASVAAKDAQAALAKQAQAVSGATALTANQMQQMSYQLNDLAVQVASGQNPLTALIQQGSQLAGTFGGLRGTVAALATVFTPIRLLAGGTAAAVGAFALAASQGASESRELARNLAITGNAAGLTEGRFNAMAQTLAKTTNSSIGVTRDTLMQLAASGRFSADSLQATADATLRLSKANGAAADEIARGFIGMTANVTAGAQELNRTYNFLNVSQLTQIQNLERQGRANDALALTMRELSSRVGDQTQNLGYLERGWQAAARKVSEYWDALKGLGRSAPSADQLKQVEALIAVQEKVAASTVGKYKQTAQEQLADLRAQAETLREVVKLESQRAAEAAKSAEATRNAAKALELKEDAKTTAQKLADQIKNYRMVLEAASQTPGSDLTKKKIDDILRNVALTSAAYAQAIDLAFARVQAGVDVSSQIVKGRLAEINSAIQLGSLSQEDGIRAVAEAEGRQLQIEKDALVAQLKIAQQRKDNAAEVARLGGQVAAAQIAINQRVRQSELDVLQVEKERRDALAGSWAQEYIAGLKLVADAQEQDILSAQRLRHAQDDYRDSLNDAAYAHGVELRASLQDGRQREIALRQLQIELQLREKLRQYARDVNDDARRAVLIQTAKDDAAAASAAAADQVTQTFDTRVYLSVRDTLTDAILEGGQAGAKRLEDLFKRLVLRPVVQAGVSSLLGSLGIGQAAATAGGIGGLAGIGSGLASGFNGFATSGLGQALGLSSAFDIGGGSGLTVMLPSGAASGIGSALSSIGPYAAAAALIFSVVRGLDKSGTPHTGSVVTADLSGVRTGGSDPSNILGHLNAQTDAALKTLTGAGVGLLNTLASTFGGAANFSAQAKFAADGVDASFGGFQLFRNGQANRQIAGTINNDAARYGSDPTKAFAAYSQDVAKTLRSALDDLNLPQWARDQINALGDSADFDKLNAVASSIAQTSKALGDFQKTLQPFGGIFSDIAGLTSDALATLANSAGGLDQLKASTSAYFEGYFSDAEKAAMQTASLSQALAAVGLQLPDTREQFRALVEQQSALGDSGRPALAALLGVAGAFADLHPALQATADAARSAADILKERADLETQLLRAQGNTSALRERELAALDASNRALQQQLYDIADTQAASEALARSLQDVAAAETRVTNAQQGVKSALQALADFGANLRAQAADTQRAIDDLRRQAASALSDANSQVQASLAALASASESASQRVASAAQAIQAAQDRKTSAGASLLSYIEQQRQGVTDAQGGVLSALDGLRNARDSALSAQQAERDKITEAYTNAQDAATAAAERLAQIQGKASTSAADLAQQMGKLRDSIGDYLAELTGSSSGLATQAAVNKATFLDLAQRAKAGDSTAISQLLGSAKAFDAASLAGSATGAEYDAARRLIRTVLGDLQSSIGSASGVDTVAAQADLDKAIAEVERLRGIAEEAGASLTKNSVDLLAEWRQSQLAASAAVTAYNGAAATVASLGLTQGQQADAWSSALATLSTAQTKLSAALAAAQAAGIQPGAVADPLQAIIDELNGAKGALDKANSDYGIALIAQASSAAALADAQSKASAAGVSIAGTTTDLSTNFAAVLAAFVAAKADVTTLGEAAASPTLLEQYQALSTKLTGINTDIAAFDEAVKGIDFSPLDTLTPLGGLLNTYSNAVNELLAAVGKQGQLTATGSFIDIGGGFSKYNSAAGATAVGKTGGDLTFFGKDGTSYQQSGIAEYVRQLIEAGDFRTIYNRALAFGLTSDDLNKFANGAGTTVLSWARSIGLPSFATGGAFGGGLRLVGEMGPEVEATGAARYYSTAQTQQMLRYGSDDVSAETKALREEVKALREDLNAALTALAGYASRQTRLQERWDGGGLLVRGDNSLPVYTKAAT